MVRAHSGDHSKSYSPRSLHRYALGKVAGLIHIAAAQNSHIVSEQLQRHDELQRHQNVVILVQADDLGGNALRHLRVLGGEQQHPRPTAAGLLGVGDGLFVDVFLGSQRNHRHTVRDQADGTVLQLPCCVGIRVHIADLLQLQAALQREGIVEPAPDEKAALGVHIAAGKVLDLLAVRKAGLNDLWRVQQLGGVILCLFLGQLPPRVGQTQGKQVQHAHCTI